MPTLSQIGQPANPAALIYQPNAIPESYQAPHALVILGRDPLAAGYATAKAAAAAGAIVGVYINVAMANPNGRYGAILHRGTKTLATGNTWGRAADLVNDHALETRFASVLEQIAAEIPFARHIFCDDQGPDNDAIYNGNSSQYRADLYPAHIRYGEIVDRFCRAHGWISHHNGEWRADREHGYPDKLRPGCALFGGLTCEHHDDNLAPGDYWRQQIERSQGGLRDAAGNGMALVISSSQAAARAAAAIPGVGWVIPQSSGQYDSAPPTVTAPRSLGIRFVDPTPSPAPPPAPSPTPPPAGGPTQAAYDAVVTELAATKAQIVALQTRIANAKAALG